MDGAEVSTGEKASIGISGGASTKIKERRGKEVRTAKSNLPNPSPICSKMGKIGISSSPPIGSRD